MGYCAIYFVRDFVFALFGVFFGFFMTHANPVVGVNLDKYPWIDKLFRPWQIMTAEEYYGIKDVIKANPAVDDAEIGQKYNLGPEVVEFMRKSIQSPGVPDGAPF